MPIVKINGVNLNYETSGKGKPVVFLHGTYASTETWSNQINAIDGRYKAIALDWRGHGKSEAPAHEDDYTMDIFCDDVFALLEKLKIDKCCLVGHSFGGFVALKFSIEHPQLLSGLVMVDCASGKFNRPPGYEQLREKLQALARSKGMEAVFEYTVDNNPQMKRKFKEHPEQKEEVRRKIVTTSVEGYIYIEKAGERRKFLTDRLSEVKTPTAIFCGEGDVMFIEGTRILNDGIKGSELITVKGSGHSPHEEKADFFNEKLISFLDRIKW